MSERKEATEDLTRELKKSSKKAAKRPTDGTVASSTIPPIGSTNGAPTTVEIPRLNFAEPKTPEVNGEGGDRTTKSRTAKKRTDTPPNSQGIASSVPSTGPVIPALNFSSSSGASLADSTSASTKNEAEEAAEKERRREAKRIKAKEAEDARRRKEELERQAIEEAERLEQQRKREEKAKKELAALNANAEECQEEDDYDNEDFENYDEDFEEPEEDGTKKNPTPLVAASKQMSTSTTTSAALQAKVKGIPKQEETSYVDLKKIQEALKAESKELSSRDNSPDQDVKLSTNNNNKAGSKSITTTDNSGAKKIIGASYSITSSIADLKQSLDPRAKRVKEILEARKFDVEKFNVYQCIPMDALDKHKNQLRRGVIRQAFTQTNDGARNIESQTENPITFEKAMHFPDDVGLDDETTVFHHRRRHNRRRTNTNNNQEEKEEKEEEREDEEEELMQQSSSRFFIFLESAAHVCEVLTEENLMEKEIELEKLKKEKKMMSLQVDSIVGTKQILPPQKATECEALLTSRSLISIRFSPYASNILLCSYGPSRNNNTILAEKSISCVWDLNHPQEPLHWLRHEGICSSSALGPSRDLIALAGTEEGTIHVWDLRSGFALKPLRYSDTNGDYFVSTPTYSTPPLQSNAKQKNDEAAHSTVSIMGHASPVVSAEVFDQTTKARGGGFQFGTMDDRGLLIIWSLVEFESNDEALLSDKCVEIGGRVKMVMNAVINTQEYIISKTPTAFSTSIGPNSTVLRFFPTDTNQFVVGTISGLLIHGNRFEKKISSTQYYLKDKFSTAKSFESAVVAVDFHPTIPEYFLVAYEDGSISLFHISISRSLCSWQEVSFGVAASSVQWSKTRAGVFYASFSDANVRVWDLTATTHGSIAILRIPKLDTFATQSVDFASNLYPMSISSEKIRTSAPSIAFRCGGPFEMVVQELGPELTAKNRKEKAEVERILSFII